MNLWIRAYEPEDLATLHAIDRVCFSRDIAYSRAELHFHIRHRDSITRVAEIDSRIVGFVVGRVHRRDIGHVLTLDVVLEVRRGGIGTSLMAALHAELKLRGVRRVFLEVDVENHGARRFYERLGYRWVERIERYYGRSDADRMELVLSPPASSD
jgi:ribosomal protein S18 acetylase RimI-like enzyme